MVVEVVAMTWSLCRSEFNVFLSSSGDVALSKAIDLAQNCRNWIGTANVQSELLKMLKRRARSDPQGLQGAILLLRYCALDEVPRELLELIEDRATPNEAKADAIESLVYFPMQGSDEAYRSQIVGVLRESIFSHDIEVQKSAIYSLGSLGSTVDLASLEAIAQASAADGNGQLAEFAFDSIFEIHYRTLRTVLEQYSLTDRRQMLWDIIEHGDNDILQMVALDQFPSVASSADLARLEEVQGSADRFGTRGSVGAALERAMRALRSST